MLVIKKLLILLIGCLLLQACAVDMQKHPYSHTDYGQSSHERLARTTPDPILARPITFHYADRSKVLPFG